MVICESTFLGIGCLCRWSSSQAQAAELPLSDGSSSAKRWQLMSAVCVERMPQITTPMNNIEADVSALLSHLEMEHSLLSDHELRHLDDL